MNEVDDELAALAGITTNDLCERYRELFGQPVRTRHRAYLVRRIAWRIQALAPCRRAVRREPAFA